MNGDLERSQNRLRHDGQTYQLGDCIGSGGSAQVFRGLNLDTGETVAIKRFNFRSISTLGLDKVMKELDLLKELDHLHIVKYKGFVRSHDHLNIIMEYCENGSLQNHYKKFGQLPENLVGFYILQVLQGLIYLHDQGVIHRDIKGANILTTKDGQVKLADFGIAVKSNQTENGLFVGSVFWMAPEVIELSGATPASDIWSLGCTVLELLEGRPPYYDLAPFSALFRIVHDEHPPFPEGISVALEDFLMQCFQKDSNLRIQGKKLLEHPWLLNVQQSLLSSSLASSRKTNQMNHAHPIEKNQTPVKQVPKRILNVAVSDKVIAVEVESDEDNWDDDFQIESIHFLDKAHPQHPSIPLPAVTPKKPREETDAIINNPGFEKHLRQPLSDHLSSSPSRSVSKRTSKNHNPIDFLTMYAETNEEDDEEEFLGSYGVDEISLKLEGFSVKEQKKIGPRDDGNDVLFQESFEEQDFKTGIVQEDHFLINKANHVVSTLESTKVDHIASQTLKDLVQICEQRQKLLSILRRPTYISQFANAVENPQGEDTLYYLLILFNMITHNDIQSQECLCMMGVLPKMLVCLYPIHHILIRTEALKLVRQLCLTGSTTLQAVLSCGGLATLSSLLDTHYAVPDRDLVWVTVDCLCGIFQAPFFAYGQNLLHILKKHDLLPRLANVFHNLNTDVEHEAKTLAAKLANLLEMFSQDNDPEIKELMASTYSMDVLIRDVESIHSTSIISVLRSLRNISTRPSTLDILQQSHLIERLCSLISHWAGPFVTEMRLYAMKILANLCKVHVERQEIAAKSGIVPIIHGFINSEDANLCDLGLPILCDMVHAGKICTDVMWECGSMNVLLDLLHDQNWQDKIMETFSVWFTNDRERIEPTLLQPKAIQEITDAFCKALPTKLHSIIDSIQRMISSSKALCQALGTTNFVYRIFIYLASAEEVLLKLSLLKLLTAICDSHPCSQVLVGHNHARQILGKLAQKDQAVLVRQLASAFIY